MCIFCKGKLKHDVTDYIENTGSLVTLVKDVPCEKCRQCGETFFDNDTVLTLEEVLSKVQHKSSDVALTVMMFTQNVA